MSNICEICHSGFKGIDPEDNLCEVCFMAAERGEEPISDEELVATLMRQSAWLKDRGFFLTGAYFVRLAFAVMPFGPTVKYVKNGGLFK